MKWSFVLFLLLTFSFLPIYAFELQGTTDPSLNSETDSIFVGLIWQYGNSQPAVYGRNCGEINHGKFDFVLDTTPPKLATLQELNLQFSVAYIVLFRDKNGNRKMDDHDEIVSASLKNCLTFVQGNWVRFLNTLEEIKHFKIPTLRHLNQGMTLARVQPKRRGFDDLRSISNRKIHLKWSANKRPIRYPNWT